MLHITGRRADGYHELQTLFQLLDWGDELVFETSAITRHPEPVVTLQDTTGLNSRENIITRAAAVLTSYAKTPCPVTINLTKRIPMGGGLGGGSTDAATTLVALNRLWGAQLSADTLAELGQQLGADVPVFVRGHSAWAEGIGERLTPVQLPTRWFVVAHPNVSVSTATLFGDRGLTRNSQKTTIRSALRGGGRNDCESVVRRRYPTIDRLLTRMSSFGESRLTGTGACCFTAFERESDARKAADALRPEATVWVARGLNESPLMPAMAALNKQL